MSTSTNSRWSLFSFCVAGSVFDRFEPHLFACMVLGSLGEVTLAKNKNGERRVSETCARKRNDAKMCFSIRQEPTFYIIGRFSDVCSQSVLNIDRLFPQALCSDELHVSSFNVAAQVVMNIPKNISSIFRVGQALTSCNCTQQWLDSFWEQLGYGLWFVYGMMSWCLPNIT